MSHFMELDETRWPGSRHFTPIYGWSVLMTLPRHLGLWVGSDPDTTKSVVPRVGKPGNLYCKNQEEGGSLAREKELPETEPNRRTQRLRWGCSPSLRTVTLSRKIGLTTDTNDSVNRFSREEGAFPVDPSWTVSHSLVFSRPKGNYTKRSGKIIQCHDRTWFVERKTGVWTSSLDLSSYSHLSSISAWSFRPSRPSSPTRGTRFH